MYNISVKNPNNKNSGVEKVVVNGAVSENKIRLEDDGVFNIEVEL